jgi:LuxR family maltose regulon positive regulatory protein
VDLGPALAGLLYQLVTRGVEPDYLGEVLTAFPPLPGAADRAQQIRQVTQVKLIEPLTERESEILLCLHKELPNKTIADALKISLLTVKRHTTNLYQKLGVETRKQAVSRARSLGILPAGHEWDSRSVRQ